VRRETLRALISQRRRLPTAAIARHVSGSLPQRSQPDENLRVRNLPQQTTLLIVRHGETDWNSEGRMQGQLDIRLNEHGRNQAAEIAAVLQSSGLAERVDAIVSSDLSRASETADIIAKACPGARRRSDAGLREVHAGDVQGKLVHGEVQGVRANLSRGWSQGKFDERYPGGESITEVVARGLTALRKAASEGSCVVVVCHGGIIKWCAVHIELGSRLPTAETMALPEIRSITSASMPNCCTSTVQYDRETDSFHCKRWFEMLGRGAALADVG